MISLLAALPKPAYTTELGAAFLGDALKLTRKLPTGSVNLIMTSPPFALNKKKAYGNVASSEYVQWFRTFAKEFWRVLRE
ncbi:MAG: site-specific DNA-methyltransferase, partial [Dehalococcoidia bacterium]